ncbi:hypothetical protein HELRODRAFT_175963 [Helobdella robusta]|uniref:Protein quiver n=1 Tax=Helobdella robusta TaxID=6412 RepID=T1F9Z2_HELRO|nr:hypothetical protein HELRODRAFT_175963 [Helobdella robusta]XP_009023950.1 hypothetical protein HELRODRAFT_177515 [Helobdella robusta]ESN97873.1 hypothetical protein HELRODRAFT_177515 [Helobdella robusta]ESO00519.1 hypothetical protein HELRODRAFT_175963 [Helobdella robusta]
MIGTVLLLTSSILFLWHPSEAVKCYKCEAIDACNSPVNANDPGVSVCNDNYCYSSKVEFMGMTASVRDCGSDVAFNECQTMTISGMPTTICTCKTDYCNGS